MSRRRRAAVFAASGVAPIQPDAIAGLQLWLKADAITGLINADPVTTWLDSSSAANDVTQATAAKKPTYRTSVINGLPIVRFDGVDDVLGRLSAVITGAEWSYFTVTQSTTMATTAFKVGDNAVDDLGSNNGFRYSPDGTNRIAFMEGIGGSSDGATTTNWEIISVTRTATGPLLEMWVNGGSVTLSNSAPGYVLATTRTLVGGQTTLPSQPWIGDIAEIIIYDSRLSAGNRDGVEVYLGNKYGIVVS